MEVSSGILNEPEKVVIYGPEWVGKSTLASQCPNPIFIDVERGSGKLDVRRTPTPTSFGMLMQTIGDLRRDPMGFNTAVLDTVDWAERLGTEEICATNGWSGLGGQNDYGKSFSVLAGKMATMLDALTDLTEAGMHVVVLAHAMTRKFELPEEMGAYDRWELKLEKKVAPILREWASMVLFYSYRTYVVRDEKTKTNKGQGGERVLRTTWTPTWDAKNRHGLPPEIVVGDNAYAPIAHCFPDFRVAGLGPKPATATAPKMMDLTPKTPPPSVAPPSNTSAIGKLRDMMNQSGVTDAELQACIAAFGHFPANTPLDNLDAKYIEGGLIANWPKVVGKIKGAA